MSELVFSSLDRKITLYVHFQVKLLIQDRDRVKVIKLEPILRQEKIGNQLPFSQEPRPKSKENQHQMMLNFLSSSDLANGRKFENNHKHNKDTEKWNSVPLFCMDNGHLSKNCSLRQQFLVPLNRLKHKAWTMDTSHMQTQGTQQTDCTLSSYPCPIA